jgi:hypothetical protein
VDGLSFIYSISAGLSFRHAPYGKKSPVGDSIRIRRQVATVNLENLVEEMLSQIF